MSWSTMSWEVNFLPFFPSSKIPWRWTNFPPLFKCIKRAPFFVFENWGDGTALVQMIMVGAEKLHQHWLHHQSSLWTRVGKNILSFLYTRVGKTRLSSGLDTVEEKKPFSSPFDKVGKILLNSTLGQSWKKNLLCSQCIAMGQSCEKLSFTLRHCSPFSRHPVQHFLNPICFFSHIIKHL